MRGILKSRRGAALIIVICVMAVMMALSLTLLSSAGLLVANSQRGYRQEQVRIAATTLNDCVRAELDGKDALSEQSGTLLNYLRQNIKPLTNKNNGWGYYASADEAVGDKYGKMHVSTLTTANLPDGFSSAIDSATLGIYYIANATKLASTDFSTQCEEVKLVVATTVYGVDGEEYTVKSSYDLSGEVVEYGLLIKEEIATWHVREKMP